ncbi:MAG: hypothetical protein ACLSW4_07610 [Clostridia bacterium]|jgi:hypothetical protein|nr:hypothetical protein [Clostridium sp.]MEE0127771.1 hypothetical protein [Clostridia bacterium]HJJ11938.1 hypothetical protein [Clostridiaceae bacterium]
MKREIIISTENEIRRRREDVYYAYYFDEIPVWLIAELSGFSERTIKRDLQYIEENLEVFRDN